MMNDTIGSSSDTIETRGTKDAGFQVRQVELSKMRLPQKTAQCGRVQWVKTLMIFYVL